MNCSLCPRSCHVPRDERPGFCGVGFEPVIARAARHDWEEPCISGPRGSGAIFFSGCNLRCTFCQNYDISALRQGKTVSVARLRAIMEELKAQGVHNINLVTPSHYILAIREALAEPIGLPVVYNSGGYDKPLALKLLEGKIQIYLPDLKYSDPRLARELSGAEDYPAVARAALQEMFRQVGPYQMGGDGLLRSGLLVRHLVLPGELDNSFGVLDWLAESFRPGDILLSLMGQYTPNGHGGPERRLKAEEYRRVVDYARALGLLEGYTQELDSAQSEYTPAFDGTGV